MACFSGGRISESLRCVVWFDFVFSGSFCFYQRRLAARVDRLVSFWYSIPVSVRLVFTSRLMNINDFWQTIISAQVATALALIAVALVFIALKLYERSNPGSLR